MCDKPASVTSYGRPSSIVGGDVVEPGLSFRHPEPAIPDILLGAGCNGHSRIT